MLESDNYLFLKKGRGRSHIDTNIPSLQIKIMNDCIFWSENYIFGKIQKTIFSIRAFFQLNITIIIYYQ